MATVARSRPKVGVGYIGPVPPIIFDIVTLAHEHGISVSSNTAREHAAEIALAASLGWISNVSLDGLAFSRTWNSTIEGLNALITHRKAI